jgi:predicted RNA-binding Zn ribbon-like protein
MAEASAGAAALKLLGGSLCLDFANTVDWWGSDQPREWLTSYDELVAWSEHAGILSPAEARRLRHRASQSPAEAEAVLQRAIALREAIHRIFSAIAEGKHAPDGDVAALDAALAEALPMLRLVRAGDEFAWAWAGEEGALERMLWPVAYSAAELLTSPALARVGQCANDLCRWLFLDGSRNHSRRWCDMADCGNRAKARRHYRRTRRAREA